MSHLSVAIDAARVAGRILRQQFAIPLNIDYKGEINIVTEVDRKSETILQEMLAAAYPDYGFLGEEGVNNHQAHGARWIVDPLDGTTNYAHGFPFFAASIALEQAGEVVLGVVYNPVLDELYTAEKGAGARLNGNPIRVSTTGELGKALVGSGFPYDAWTTDQDNVATWARFVKSALSVRCDGAAALDLCHVAVGRLDAFWERDLAPWDMAAGALIAAEAGGAISACDGSPFHLGQPGILADNGRLHDKMLEIINRD
ncbi:MAG: inositol monophosphatase family protein [Anaerolineales bacterium]|nr:inositol monophosphatase family protein [Anaerolineales bacterium]